MILSMVSGAGVVCAGLWMLWGKRIFGDDAGEGGLAGADRGAEAVAGPRPIRDRFTDPTRLVIGVSLLIAGYHIAAWGTPDDWFGVKVPNDRWWMLACGLPLAVGASLAVDRLERKGSAG